ncbi:MAG: Ig-like domain-containing protein [Bryobacteraceae bacterium]
MPIRNSPVAFSIRKPRNSSPTWLTRQCGGIMLTRTLAFLQFSLLLSFTTASYAQPQIYAGDYQTASVDYLTFAIPLQVRTSICIDMPCTQYSVTFVSPDARLAVFCPSSPCIPSTTITVANPSNSELATVTLWVGTLAASYLITATTRGATLYFHETNIAGQPAAITAAGGSPQSVRIGETYSSLTAAVTDSYGNPNAGLLVTFTAPLPINHGVSAPTALFNGSSLTATATTNSTGRAFSPPLVANLTGGPFTVTAAVSGLTNPATFSLTNLIPITIQTNPTGRSFTVDGVSFTSTQVFSWLPGSTHTLSTTSPQPGPTGTQYTWASWSDAGPISHTITAATGAVFTAAFNTQYLLTTSASPSAGGAVTPPTGYYNSGQSVALSATANPASPSPTGPAAAQAHTPAPTPRALSP